MPGEKSTNRSLRKRKETSPETVPAVPGGGTLQGLPRFAAQHQKVKDLRNPTTAGIVVDAGAYPNGKDCERISLAREIFAPPLYRVSIDPETCP